MAFTPEQETTLKQIIEAFQNGKRLSDLPNVSGTNPYNLFCEVLDEDGESKKAALATLLPYMEDECSYGVEFDTEVGTPACTRIGNLVLHKTLPVQNRMKGCLLDDKGAVVEYLNPQDWRGQVRDGSRGQVMVEIPMFYWKFTTEGTKRSVRISEFPLPGYHQVKQQYISAYEATVQRSTSKLSSVVNSDADFRGGNNNDGWDGSYRTLLGRPATVISRTSFRKYARNRNASASTEWNCMTYELQKVLYWLFVVEYATLNSQATFTAELTEQGYHKGGLGAGVTNVTDWNGFNGYYPFVPCGHTDSLGNGSGEVEYTAQNDDLDKPIIQNVLANRYRGVENPFGHIWKWTDGINVCISPNEENGGNGLSKVFICKDPAKFTDSNYEGYSHVGNETRAEGYVKKIIFGEMGEIMPEKVGGGSSLFHCDYHYTNIPTSSEALRGLLFGGSAHSGATAGFVCASSSNAPSHAAAGFGSRLCFIPQSA